MAELDTYRRRRRADRTPEPVPEPGPLPAGRDDTFVVQEHHARSLHWDFRLERGGVLVSWAVPKGLPNDPGTNHLAVHTEDHPLEYASFAGEIPAGEYGGGVVRIFDAGHYETEKWTEREVKVVLHGRRLHGRYVLFRTRGRNWMVHRMDPPAPGFTPLPTEPAPMLAAAGELPTRPGWAYEFKWDGVRLLVAVSGGRPRAWSRGGRDVTSGYPELRRLAEALAGRELLLDGEAVAFDRGRPSFAALQRRMHVARPTGRLLAEVPVNYLAFDLLHLDGRSLLDEPYRERRRLLDGLALSGPHWDTAPWFVDDGPAVLATARGQGLEGVVAKRLDSPYQPGRRSPAWVKVKLLRTQEVVVGGYREGAGRRAGTVGSLLLGLPGPAGLTYVGHVGTGFSDRTLDDLRQRLAPLRREGSPFAGKLPAADAKGAVWVAPQLVGEVAFGEWTPDDRLRHPSWRGLRPDKDPLEVVRGG